MSDQPVYAEDYQPEHLEYARSTCLTAATFFGDILDDLVVVGGLVPGLLIPQTNLPEGADRHVGTRDLDIAFSLGILNKEKYREIRKQLEAADFAPDRNEDGNISVQRWLRKDGLGVTIDFLIPPSGPEDEGGTIKHLEKNFGAYIIPGLHLAFEDRIAIDLSNQTLLGAEAERRVWVCGPGAFIVLKALAFRKRGLYKDAYDLFYVLRNFGEGPQDIFRHLESLLDEEECFLAIEILRLDFTNPNSLGPRRVAEFQFKRRDVNLQADVAGYVKQLLELCNV